MKEAYQWLIQHFSLSSNDTIVVAVSGGPDSMALLSLLLDLRQEKKVQIICAHVNHQIRKESEEEYHFVEQFCSQNAIIFEGFCIEKYGHDNFHQDAREQRYQFFERIVQKYHARYLMTAHHGDDLMETILMRLVRGSHLKGYAGFAAISNYQTYQVVRPLIKVTKEDILKYNSFRKIPYVMDLSNFKDTYTRNRYRKQILPMLKKEDPHVHYKFGQFSQSLLEATAYINSQVACQKPEVYQNHKIIISKMILLDPFLQKEIIYAIFEELYQDQLYMVSHRHVDFILNLLKSSKNQVISLPNDYIALKEYDFLSIQKVEKQENYQVEFHGFLELKNGKKIEQVSEANTDGNDVCRLQKDDISLPLYVRNRRLGDKMTVKGMEKAKKIKDIFIDLKIPKQARNEWPIVVDQNGTIVWIPGLKKSKFNLEMSQKCDIILKYY